MDQRRKKFTFLAVIALGLILAATLFLLRRQQALQACLVGEGHCEPVKFFVGLHQVEISAKASVPGDNGPVSVEVSRDGELVDIFSSEFNDDTLMDKPPLFISWWWLDHDLKLDLILSRPPWLMLPKKYLSSLDGRVRDLQDHRVDESPCIMAKKFYQKYLGINELHRQSGTWASLTDFSALFQEFLTPQCRENVARVEFYDPIIQAQDWSPNWPQSLVVHQGQEELLCQVDIDPRWPQKINVRLVKEGRVYRIAAFEKPL